MKAILAEISFFEAHFKVHYTKTFRLSYPIPLPTTITGIFGALLGIDRKDILNQFSNLYLGAKLIRPFKENFESFTFIQIPWDIKKKGTWPPGIVPLQLLNEPSYQLVVAGPNNQIDNYYQQLKKSFIYLPYGGQNDFFVKDIKILKTVEVEEKFILENYAPKNLVDKVEVINEEGAFLITLPVMHKFIPKEDPFYFGYKVRIYLKEKIPTVNGIGLYELSKFYYPNQ
ncbi:MAG: CRISPR-associated protein Cas5 [Candidatus Omnitrophica bacterium]|nr:CRISPR-associated protein Cas5 [Candidatus Omnitrophota bacterium]